MKKTLKKTLLALAVMGTFAGAASAQSSVTVYGVMDAGIVSESGGAAGSVTKMTSGVQSGSRLGFKGTEDLGGGLSANFVIEAGILGDTGASSQGGVTFGRQTTVGLKGNFGAINLGRQYNLITTVAGLIDPFGGGHEGAYSNIMDFSTRVSNGIYYTTPSMGGFVGDLAYGFGEVAGNTSANRELGLALSYTGGPLYAVLVHRNRNNATATNSNKITILGGTYNFGPATAALSYAANKDDVSIDSNDTLVGVSVPAGAGTFMASYLRHKDKSALNKNANQAAIGYTYALSKRTNLYTSYASISNSNGAAYTVGNATDVGTGDKGFAVGIRHKF